MKTTVANGIIVPETNSITGPQHDVPETVDEDLVTILSWPRKHESLSEYQFQVWLKAKLKSLTGKEPSTHRFQALSVTIPFPGDKKEPSTTLFSCHTDTCDTVPTGPDQRKRLAYDSMLGHIILDKGDPSACLGADDGVGVWLMLKMIEAKVPGTYLFNRGEECGGISAKAIASAEQDWLKKFEVCVAFDRPRDNEVITHQRGQTECASDKFGKALADALNAHGMDYRTSRAGVYTDNFEFRRYIAECVNIGVGYEMQHSPKETQDYAHLFALMNACLKVQWDALPVDRDPAKAVDYDANGWWAGSVYGGQSAFDFDKPKKSTKKSKPKLPPHFVPAEQKSMGSLLDEVGVMGADDIFCMVQDEPEMAALTIMSLMREINKLRADNEWLESMLESYQ